MSVCPDCGEKIINRGAHYEACPGRPVSCWPAACKVLVPAGFGLRYPCSLPQGHRGPHTR